MIDIGIPNRITRGSSPQAELRQGFFNWMKRLRTIEERHTDASSSGSSGDQGIENSSVDAPKSSPNPDSPDGENRQDGGGESS